MNYWGGECLAQSHPVMNRKKIINKAICQHCFQKQAEKASSSSYIFFFLVVWINHKAGKRIITNNPPEVISCGHSLLQEVHILSLHHPSISQMAIVPSVLYQVPNILIVQFMNPLYFIEMFTNTYL